MVDETEGPFPRWLVPCGFFVGVICMLLVTLLVTFWASDPSDKQFAIYRTVLALGGAGFSLAFTGFLTIKLHLPKKGLIVAGGTLAVLVLLYRFPPALLDARTEATVPAGTTPNAAEPTTNAGSSTK